MQASMIDDLSVVIYELKLLLEKLWKALITFAQSSGVTCLATREWVDLISGKSDMAVVCKASNFEFL